MTNELTVTNEVTETKLIGYELLGCPYNIHGRYASAYAVNTAKRLFNLPEADTEITIDGQKYSYPQAAIGDPLRLDGARSLEYTAESTEQAYTKISTHAKLEASSNLFSGELSSRFSTSHASSSYFYYAERSAYIHSYKLILELDYARDNLDQNFKNDVDNKNNDGTYVMTAKELVEKYGTHFLYEAIFGGRLSYTQSFSKFSNTEFEKLEAKVKARYGIYKGETSVDYEANTSDSKADSEAVYSCVGGEPETLEQGYEAWAATVSPTNSMFVDFGDNGDSLMRISELVNYDDIRREQIDAAIEEALKVNLPNTKLTTSTKPEDQEEFFQGNKNNLEVDSGASDDGSVVVGFGSKINSNGDFSRIAVCYLDMSTGKRTWKEFGNVDTYNRTDYDTIGEVPDGCVLTGIGFMGKLKLSSLTPSLMLKMVLNYQEITPASSTYNYLDNNLQQTAFIGEKETDVGDDDYHIEFNPDNNNDMVITGIGVNFKGDKLKVNRLKLYRNILVDPDDEPTDD